MKMILNDEWDYVWCINNIYDRRKWTDGHSRRLRNSNSRYWTFCNASQPNLINQSGLRLSATSITHKVPIYDVNCRQSITNRSSMCSLFAQEWDSMTSECSCKISVALSKLHLGCTKIIVWKTWSSSFQTRKRYLLCVCSLSSWFIE